MNKQHIRIIPLACLFAVFFNNAKAFNITHNIIKNTVNITIKGDINIGDDQKFYNRIDRYIHEYNGKSIIIILNSQGGEITPALNIGRYIAQSNFATLVKRKTICASACGLIWIAGNKYAYLNSKIGFHAAYDEKFKISSSANALVGKYLGELNLMDDAIFLLTRQSPKDMEWINFRIMKDVGVKMTILDDDDYPNNICHITTSNNLSCKEQGTIKMTEESFHYCNKYDEEPSTISNCEELYQPLP